MKRPAHLPAVGAYGEHQVYHFAAGIDVVGQDVPYSYRITVRIVGPGDHNVISLELRQGWCAGLGVKLVNAPRSPYATRRFLMTVAASA